MMWYAHDGMSGWGWLSMAFMMALVWLPLLLIAWWLVRQFLQVGPAGSGEQSSLRDEVAAPEVARRAYARGELSRERFREIIADLQGPLESEPQGQDANT